MEELQETIDTIEIIYQIIYDLEEGTREMDYDTLTQLDSDINQSINELSFVISDLKAVQLKVKNKDFLN